MERLVALADAFVDGVLSVFEIRAERVETDELCVDGVCITADDLRTILENNQSEEVTPTPSFEAIRDVAMRERG